MPDLAKLTGQSLLAHTFAGFCRELRAGRYYVYRGPYAFAEHKWDRYPHVIAISVDDSRPWSEDASNRCTLLVTIGAKFESEHGIDDYLQTEFFQDIESVIHKTNTARVDGIVVGTANRSEIETIEVIDPDAHIQGVLISIPYRFL